jgi:hypothetical protein
MGSTDLPKAAAACQQNLYTVSQRCAVFVYRHNNVRKTGIHEAGCGVDVLPLAAKPSDDANSSCVQQRDRQQIRRKIAGRMTNKKNSWATNTA